MTAWAGLTGRVTPPETYARDVLSQRFDIELDRSATKGQFVESEIPRFQKDHSVREAFLPHKLHVRLIADRMPVT